MGNEIALKKQNELTFSEMQSQAQLLIKSGFLPSAIKTPEQALTIMLTGKELGLGLMESLRSINVIQGRPAMSAQLLLGLCYRTREVEKAYMKSSSDTEATFILQRKGSPEFVSTFTREEADRAKFSMQFDRDKQQWKPKDNWAKQPRTMLEWRAISRACRVLFPDAICGIYTPEELADEIDVKVDEKTGEVEVVETRTAEEPPPPPARNVSDVPPTPVENLEFDQLANYQMKAGRYAGMKLIDLYENKTGTGGQKGKSYLVWLTENAKDAELREVVGKFLRMMDNAEREPGSEG